jgi:archaellum component FlaC
VSAEVKDIAMVISTLLGIYSTYRVMRKETVEQETKQGDLRVKAVSESVTSKLIENELSHIKEKVDAISKQLEDKLPSRLEAIDNRLTAVERDLLKVTLLQRGPSTDGP